MAPIPLEIATSHLDGSVHEKAGKDALVEGSFEEGGLRGWMNVAGAFVSWVAAQLDVFDTLPLQIVLMVTFGCKFDTRRRAKRDGQLTLSSSLLSLMQMPTRESYTSVESVYSTDAP